MNAAPGNIPMEPQGQVPPNDADPLMTGVPCSNAGDVKVAVLTENSNVVSQAPYDDINHTANDTPLQETPSNGGDVKLTVFTENSKAVGQAPNDDISNTANDSPLKQTPSNDSHSNEPPPLKQDETFLSGTESDISSDSQPEEKGQKYCLVRYTLIYTVAFLLVAIVVVIPLALKTDVFKQNETSTSELREPIPSPTGGLQLPAPADTPAPSAPEQSSSPLAPVVSGSAVATELPVATPVPTTPAPTTASPTMSPSEALVTMPPIPDGETHAPTTLAPTETPTTAGPTFTPSVPSATPSAEPTQSPSASPTNSPTTLAPTSGSPSSSPTWSDLTNTPLFAYLVALGTPEDVLADPTTPQGKAFLWLMEPDVMQISVFRVPQRFALVALDFALHDDDANVVSGWKQWFNWRQEESAFKPWVQMDKDVCEWQGVTCDIHKEVVGIKWSNQKLRGKLIPELKLLSKLQKLDIAENEVSGGLEHFWDLPELTHLYAFSNKLSGTIPDGRPAPRNLKHVYLGHNELTGTLPLTLASSKNDGPAEIRYLILHHNKLTGTLPDGMRLRNLFYLDLSNNEFEGSVPTDWLLYYDQLRFLYLDNNNLSGNLPDNFDTIGNSRLKQLFINNNSFSGHFPSESWDDYFMTNMNIAENNFDSVDKNICKIGVLEGEGELVEFRADCDICRCDTLCHTCVGGEEEEMEDDDK